MYVLIVSRFGVLLLLVQLHRCSYVFIC